MGDRDIKLSKSLGDEMVFRYKEIATDVHAEQIAIWPLDGLVNGVVTITYPHHEVHSGSTFEASYKSPEGGDIADNASLDMLIVTAVTKEAHLVFEVQAGGDCEVFMYEATVTTDDGTAILEANMNRGSTKATTVTTTHTPTVAGGAEGTQLYNAFVPGGQRNQAAGGAVRSGTEWILKVSTKYMIRVTNRAGGAKPVGIVAEWYEESV